ncbi:metal ABC transporter solute-binding protein, Zn/Mn family [Cytobacillus purgationiresistens]|uniref:Manganese/zinc/iron transport system substrate-binding protein n=1 Tax=Cytobacillus purgationiresistens TaxID=863449 RepID=A0ABU0ALX6_9BACI|nr:zinc ABC transporter substrate-binding protein [Cytobacillus purgationiresistens]MDQ0272040.1 manganese/zinc/iron transport system substrate-binding protein [Cytobacillus purgationiresistens]
MNKIFAGLIVSVLLLLSACSNEADSTSKNGDGKLKVTTTIAQIADGVKNIGGDKVEVQSLMGPGTDPHLYKATQSDISKLQGAEIIFYNGLNLEGKLHDILEKMNEQKPVYAIAETIKEDELLDDVENNNAIDPHVWFDIDLWHQALETVKEGLIEADPDNGAYYEENAKQYFNKLNELKAYATEELTQIPEEQRVLVTAHDAFGYFGAAYNLEVMGLQGLSTDAEFGLGDVKHLVDTLATREIKAVFVESSISERSINAVIEGSQQKGHGVSIGGELYSDAMGEEGTEEGTYIGMYKHNVDTIAEALK